MAEEEVLLKRRFHKAKSIDSIRLENNQVLCRTISDNMNTPTKAGIIKASKQFEKNQYLDNYVNRVHEIIKVPDHLVFFNRFNKFSDRCMRWKCDMEIAPGDVVWSNYMAMLDLDGFIVGDIEYVLINYKDLKLAKKPDGSYVALNGNILYSHPKIVRPTILEDPNPITDYSKCVVILAGKPNKSYIVGEKKWVDLDGGLELKPGDVLLKHNKANKLILEDDLFHYYPDFPVYTTQRREIVAVVC
jgi:hypothetical protein